MTARREQDELEEHVIATRRVLVKQLELMHKTDQPVTAEMSDALEQAWDDYDDAVAAMRAPKEGPDGQH